MLQYVNENYLRTNSTKVVDTVKYSCWQTTLARFTVSWLFIVYCQNDKRVQRACKLELEFFPATRKRIDELKDDVYHAEYSDR